MKPWGVPKPRDVEIATLKAPLGLERFIPLMGVQTLAAQNPHTVFRLHLKDP